MAESPSCKKGETNDGRWYSVLIVDSIMALFRCKFVLQDGCAKMFVADFVGRGELSERQQRLGTLLNQYKKLSERHNIAVVYTNL